MAVKILIGGKSAPLQDYFLYSLPEVKCLSTSDVWEDITAHMELFSPDVYLYYYTQPDSEAVELLRSLITENKDNRVRFAVAGSAECMSELDKSLTEFKGLKITLPDTIVNIENRLTEYVKKTLPGASPQGEGNTGKNDIDALAAAVTASDKLDDLFEELMQSVKGIEREAAAAPAPAPKKAPAAPAVHKKHILVIDDDRAILKMLKAALSEQYDVTTTITGKIAEKFLETKNADLILLDYEMPGESGPEVLKKLRANDKSKDIPVVFLTGVADSERIRSVLELSPRGYMLKPINIERLTSTIKGIIG